VISTASLFPRFSRRGKIQRSFMDRVARNSGCKERAGLIRADYETLAGTPGDSARRRARVIGRSGAIIC
jgi:hypothetical protein